MPIGSALNCGATPYNLGLYTKHKFAKFSPYKHIFNLEFNIHSWLFKRHLLEMDLGDLTIYVCSYHLFIIIFPFPNYQSRQVFLNFIVIWCIRSSMDAPSSFVLPCHCHPVRKFQISSEISQQHFRLIWSHIYFLFVVVNRRTHRKHQNIKMKDKRLKLGQRIITVWCNHRQFPNRVLHKAGERKGCQAVYWTYYVLFSVNG